jgi:muramoyltetrapeptide carboxypeptidase
MRRPRRPPPVGPGDVVGVAALSSTVDRTALDAGISRLEQLGFRVRPASNLYADWQGFAGTDRERVAGFHQLVAAPEVKAIVFARGGHGVLRVLPAIDWELLAASPKAYVGYSDVVPLLLQIVTRLRLICFHGPMVASDLAAPLGADEERSLLDALAGKLGRSLPCDCADDAPAVEGRLLGGCLAMLTASLGTPWFPRLDDSLLFLEDVNEPLYRLDRMLTQLQLSGRVRRVKAMILGHLGGVGELRQRPIDGEPRPILAWNLPSGHGRPNLTLPLGALGRLDPEARALVVLDDGGPTARRRARG